MPLYKVIVEKHQDGYVAYPLGLSYALPTSLVRIHLVHRMNTLPAKNLTHRA